LIFHSCNHTKHLAHHYQCYEQQRFNDFINRLFDLDQQSRLHNLVWAEFTQSIRVLLDNQYVFQPYWDYANGKLTEKQWIAKFDKARKIASKALGKGNSPAVLSISLSRLYTLRNQLMHGGATWNSYVNRGQIRDCKKLVGCLVPLIIEIMMDNPNEIWGQPCYPVISE